MISKTSLTLLRRMGFEGLEPAGPVIEVLELYDMKLGPCRFPHRPHSARLRAVKGQRPSIIRF